MIKGVLLDLSGTVYVGNEVLPGALEAVERLQAQNIPLTLPHQQLAQPP